MRETAAVQPLPPRPEVRETVAVQPLPPPPPVASRLPLLVEPLDRVGIALPELKMQRFGSKCLDCEASDVATGAALHHEGPTAMAALSSFFQMDSEQAQTVEAPDVRQVGEVAADHPAPVQDNSTARNEPSQVGFVAAAQPPPALPEVPPLPFMPDGMSALGGHIHVSATVATQEVSKSSQQGENATSAVAQDDAWVNFTVAEALRGSNRDAEALATDTAPAHLPPFAEEPGHLHPKEASSSAVSATVAPEAHSPPVIEASVEPLITGDPAAAPESGFIARHSMLLFWLLALSFIALIGSCLACAGAGFVASFMWQRRFAQTNARSQVEDLALCRANEVEKMLPSSGGYDCHFSKPLSSNQLIRLEARIEGPATGGTVLTAPLTGQACVLYSAAVSRQLHDGIRPAPVAFASGSIDFVISLKDSPHIRINLQAEEVSLFDMRRGRHIQRRSFAAAPDKWQDFILSHRAGTEWQTSSQLQTDGSSLEFQECALLCNTIVTFVGELHRGADGTLSLRPMQSVVGSVSGASAVRDRGSGLSERWRTSWECGGTEATNLSSHPPTPREKIMDASLDKVMATDDPLLLEGGSWLVSAMSLQMSRLLTAGMYHGSCALNFMTSSRGGKRPCTDKWPAENHTL